MNKKNISAKAITLKEYCSLNERVCPLPNPWLNIWNMLPNKKRNGNDWNPSLPLILGAWHDTPNLLKILRIFEHIEWADANGVIDEVDDYLRSLDESSWLHFGE